MPHFLQRVYTMHGKKITVDGVIDLISSVAFVGLLLLTLSNVLCDWITQKRFGEIEELVQILFVWTVYAEAGLLYKNDEHIKVTFIYNLFPPRGQRVLSILIDLISFATASVTAYFALKLAIKSINKYTSVLHFSYFYIDMAVVVGFVFLAVFIIYKMVRSLRTGLSEGEKDA